MSRPVIGVTTYRRPATWGRWTEVDATLLPAAYVDAVRRGGGTPLLIPPLGPGDGAIDIVRRLDGLVIAGGSDVNPSRYGQEPHERTRGWDDDRDVSEMALLHAADDLDLPVLGVCRGMQVMAVVDGGHLLQHVPDVVGTDAHCPGVDVYGTVEVHTVAGSRVAGILGPVTRVGCHHHQAVADVGDRSVPVAHAADGLLEAMEAPGERFRVGVQWHPETLADPAVFAALAHAALAHAALAHAAAARMRG